MAEGASVCRESSLLPMPMVGVLPAAFGRALARFEPSLMHLGTAAENPYLLWVGGPSVTGRVAPRRKPGA